MSIHDAEMVSAAFEQLKKKGFGRVALDISRFTKGELQPDSTALWKLVNSGQHGPLESRILDSDDKATLFTLSLALHAVVNDEAMAAPSIVQQTRKLCHSILGPYWTPPFLDALEARAAQLTRSDFSRFIRSLLDDELRWLDARRT